MRQHELAGVEELGDQALADLQHLLVERGVGAEPRGRRPVAHAVGAVLVEQVHRRHHVAPALRHLLAVGIEDPAGDDHVLPGDRALVQQRLRDGVERPGPDDLVALRPHVRGEELARGAPDRAASRELICGVSELVNQVSSTSGSRGEAARPVALLVGEARRHVDRRVDRQRRRARHDRRARGRACRRRRAGTRPGIGTPK